VVSSWIPQKIYDMYMCCGMWDGAYVRVACMAGAAPLLRDATSVAVVACSCGGLGLGPRPGRAVDLHHYARIASTLIADYGRSMTSCKQGPLAPLAPRTRTPSR
jgi:hypothetical protein